MGYFRPVDRTKIYIGIFLLCISAIIMLSKMDSAYPFLRAVWIGLFAAGLCFYLWGRFFSRGSS